MDKKNSFSEELLSGYLDGELSEEDSEKVHQFAVSSVDLREDLLSLSRVGEIFSNNLKSSTPDLNIWEAIEGRLVTKRSEPAAPRLVVEEPRISAGFWSSIFSPGFGAVLALGLFAVGMVSSQWVELPSENGSLKYSKISESDIPLDKKEILVPLIQNNRAGSSHTFVSNGFPTERANNFNYSPQFISPQQLGAEHPARAAGVREDGMQIEWMKNSKDVRFLRHKNESLPPMIWLGDFR
jgi:hypothetical protein